MRESTHILFRQWQLLVNLPHHPYRISVSEMRAKLEAQQVLASVRTIQRDMEQLSGIFPITCDTEGKRNFWYWTDADKALEIPFMSAPTALAFHLARAFLEPQLPPGTVDTLSPYFRRATQVLECTDLANWPERVVILESGPPLSPPDLCKEVQRVVYEALLTETRFTARYLSREKGEVAQYEVSPLGLVIREGVFYLVATLWDYEDVRQLALHRMAEAAASETPVIRPEGFDLRAYVEADEPFAYPLSRNRLRLKALFDEGAAYHLGERRLSSDQTLKVQPDGRVLLSATMADTQALRWWLLGFGAGVEVLAPKTLRGEMAGVVADMGARYKVQAKK